MSKVMVSSSGGKMILYYGKCPCGEGVYANSVKCAVC